MTPDKDATSTEEPEIAALSQVYIALKELTPDAQNRVLDYVSRRLNLKRWTPPDIHEENVHDEPEREVPSADRHEKRDEAQSDSDDDLDGISPVAKKWMRRNGLESKLLSSVFSLGADEIDLVAKKVPGKGKKDKMRSVFLLKGLASYLGSGAARFKDDEIRETCEHYGAYDQPNFASNLKSFSSIVSGTKASGYTLTTRGLTEATALLKEISGQTQGSTG